MTSRFPSAHDCADISIYRDRLLGRPQDPEGPEFFPIGAGEMLFTSGGAMQFTNDSGIMEYTDV